MILVTEVHEMETKDVIFGLRTKKGLISGRTGCEGHGHEAGGVPMGKTEFPIVKDTTPNITNSR